MTFKSFIVVKKSYQLIDFFNTIFELQQLENFSISRIHEFKHLISCEIPKLTTFEEGKMFEPRFIAGPDFGGVCLLGKRKHVRWIDTATDDCVKAVSSLFYKSDKRIYVYKQG